MHQNIVFRNFDPLYYEMIECMEHLEIHSEMMENRILDFSGRLIDYSLKSGLQGNLWKTFLAKELILNENAYTLLFERADFVSESMKDIVLLDIRKIYELYHFDLKQFNIKYPYFPMDHLMNFQVEKIRKQSVYIDLIMDFTVELDRAKSPEEMLEIMISFYQKHGVGKFAIYHAFRLKDQGEDLNPAITFEPIEYIEKIYLDDLIGYEIPKKKLIDNTEAFLNGKPANNCLLFGDAGTGKSSSVKAILNAYAEQGLRIIEVYKHQFHKLNDLMKVLKDRNYKFIIYMDDLSFENFEVEYKYLKAIIEGGLGEKPPHVLIYATSNRRHLIREKYSDKEDVREDMHTSETVQEKLSLVARFGVSIFFCRPDRKEFQKIVTTLAKRYHIEIAEEELIYKANQWELSHGGLSGRTAKQFIDYIRGGIEDES